ncbi:unnamed protein product [Discosporangium mesarthrocarpum]
MRRGRRKKRMMMMVWFMFDQGRGHLRMRRRRTMVRGRRTMRRGKMRMGMISPQPRNRGHLDDIRMGSRDRVRVGAETGKGATEWVCGCT